MIITLTANPSVDRTVDLAGPLERGAVLRATGVGSQAGGKGVNISRAATQAGVPTVAVLPAAEQDPFLTGLRGDGIACRAVPAGPVRVNLTLTEPDGTTTKVNTPGGPVDSHLLGALADAVEETLETTRTRPGLDAGPSWVVLAGSLPPGAPTDWYVDLVPGLRDRGAYVAIDTSDAPLAALGRAIADPARAAAVAPDLLKPNGEELAALVRSLGGTATGEELEADAYAAAAAATRLLEHGVGVVLATLGARGAVLVTTDASGRTRSWHATPPPTTVLSTVGAGDCSLFGYLRAALEGGTPPERLASAVAWGAAAAGLPGTTIPAPEQVDIDLVTVRELELATTPGGTA
ncbi:hexose kinase [Nocardioidaceae bacterium]|nr:hexose kinase [Nocardioidaceae bacterium]